MSATQLMSDPQEEFSGFTVNQDRRRSTPTPQIIFSPTTLSHSSGTGSSSFNQRQAQRGPSRYASSNFAPQEDGHTQDVLLMENGHETNPRKPPPKTLGVFDVFALVFNKIVGTGIFTTPGLVLFLTGNPIVAICLWLAGGVHTLLSLWLYLSLGTRFAHNGGELVYFDRIYYNGFMMVIFFAGSTLAFGHTAGNAIQFGRYIYTCIVGPDEEINPGWVQFIAICAMFLVCFILYTVPAAGMFLNKILALFKIVLLLVVLSVAFSLTPQDGNALSKEVEQRPSNFYDTMTAFVYVIYSYTGWENANFVAGEIRDLRPSRRNTLLLGSFSALGLSIVLYILVVTAYFRAESAASISASWTSLGMGADFGRRAFPNNGLAFNVMVSLSAFGNLIAVVFTSAKIKQAIARQRFIPFWSYVQHGSLKSSAVPEGGLVLHFWITFIWILVVPPGRDAYTFVVGIRTYSRLIIEFLVFAGFIIGVWRIQDLHFLWKRTVGCLLAIVVAGFALVILIFAAKESARGPNSVKTIIVPRYWWPASIGVIAAFCLAYWAILYFLQMQVPQWRAKRTAGEHEMNGANPGRHQAQPLGIDGHGGVNDVHQSRLGAQQTFGELLGVEVHIHRDTDNRDDDDNFFSDRRPYIAAVDKHRSPEIIQAMREAEEEGSYRRMETEFTGGFLYRMLSSGQRRKLGRTKAWFSKAWKTFGDVMF